MIKLVGTLDGVEGVGFLKMWRTLVDPATRMWQDHRHANFEIALVVSGQGMYQTVGGLQPIAPGDVFVFPGNEPHWIRQIMAGGLEILNLHFSFDLFERHCAIAHKYPNLFFAHSEGFGGRIPAGEAEVLAGLVEQLRRELERQQAEYDSFVYGLIDRFFCELIRSHGYYLPTEGVHRAMERIREGLRYIDAHYTEDITLEQIAEKSNLSPHYFTRLFRECFHIRLWDHVLSKRIDAAKRLLSSRRELTVLEIAMRCGFHNTANFNRIFLRFTGVTPSEYKQGRALH